MYVYIQKKKTLKYKMLNKSVKFLKNNLKYKNVVNILEKKTIE